MPPTLPWIRKRRVVDRDRLGGELKIAVHAVDRQCEIEPGAESEMVERARHRLVGAAAEGEVELGARLDVRKFGGGGDAVGDRLGLVRTDAGALEHAGEAVARAERGGRPGFAGVRAYR